MAMPRELFLFEGKAGLRGGQRFVRELNQALSLMWETPEQVAVALIFHRRSKFSADVMLQDSQTLHLNVYQDNQLYF